MSTLAQIRQDFVKKNGRFDLVVDTDAYADNGANFYIQVGQRLLDSILPHRKSLGRYVKDLTADDYKLMMKYVRSIDSVYVKTSGEDRAEVERKSYSWLIEEYGDDIANIDTGTPLYYSPIQSIISPEQKDLTDANYTSEFTYDYGDIMFGSERYQKDGITFRPPADKVYTMTVFAHFFSLLSADADISYHSEMYPELLLMASNWAIEAFYRNSQGMLDWEHSMNKIIKGIDHDLVRAEMALAGNQMRG